jgi:hypothetical protein
MCIKVLESVSFFLGAKKCSNLNFPSIESEHVRPSAEADFDFEKDQQVQANG